MMRKPGKTGFEIVEDGVSHGSEITEAMVTIG